MAATISPQSLIARAEGMVEAPLGDELMMMSIAQGTYFGLNDIGAAIWQRIAAPVTVDSLCAALQDEFDVSPEQCRADVMAFLVQMRDSGLVRVVG